MVQATLQVYKTAIRTFLPTPAKSHYVFNLRDFSRVIKGVRLVPAAQMTEAEKLMRLWVHEVRIELVRQFINRPFLSCSFIYWSDVYL